MFGGIARADLGAPGDIKRFALAITEYCAEANASITSWYRTPKRNKLVGGRPNSRHLKGLAADVVYDEALGKAHRTGIAKRYGLVILFEKTHDHITLA